MISIRIFDLWSRPRATSRQISHWMVFVAYKMVKNGIFISNNLPLATNEADTRTHTWTPTTAIGENAMHCISPTSIKKNICRFWHLPSNDLIAKIVLHHLDLLFEGQIFETLIILKRLELAQRCMQQLL